MAKFLGLFTREYFVKYILIVSRSRYLVAMQSRGINSECRFVQQYRHYSTLILFLEINMWWITGICLFLCMHANYWHLRLYLSLSKTQGIVTYFPKIAIENYYKLGPSDIKLLQPFGTPQDLIIILPIWVRFFFRKEKSCGLLLFC